MTSDLVTGLLSTLQGSLGQAVTYHRGASSVSVTAVPGRSDYEVDTEYGVERSVTRDFIIEAADLVIGGSVITPQRGDQVKQTVGSDVLVFEVMPPADGVDCYNLDQTGTSCRVHARQVDTE